MSKAMLSSLVDKAGMVALLVLAALLRSDLTYRSAFVDEALNIRLGWQMLHGIPTYFLRFHMAYAPLTSIPWAIIDRAGGLQAVRGLNVLFGVLTVLFVMLIARKIYGQAAGYIAGGVFAVFAPAIFISTLGVYDIWSVFFVSLALYLWTVALADELDYLLAWGSLAMCVGIFAKYTAVVVSVLLVGYAVVLALVGVLRRRNGEGSTVGTILKKLVLWGVPFILIFDYALFFREELAMAWSAKATIMVAQGQDGLRWGMLNEFAGYLGLLFVLGLPALFWGKRRLFSFGLLIVGLSMLFYHQAAMDPNQIHKHVVYMAVGLAPLASGGIVFLVRQVLVRASARLQHTVIALVGALVIAYLGLTGQTLLPLLRSYWSDTAEAVDYLRKELKDGDLVLMEGGDVGFYYFIVHGAPGHIPADVVSTWWYEDELGQGVDALKRAIDQQKFAFIVFDDHFTKQTNDQLREAMVNRYALEKTFPAHRFGEYGQIEVFRSAGGEMGNEEQ